MAPMKRPAASSAKAVGPVLKKCKVVASAVLGAEGLPLEVKGMLGNNLPECLGVAKEDRHPFQEKVCAMVSEVLKSVETSIEAEIATAEGKVGESETEKASRLAAEEAADTTMKAKAEALAAAQTAQLDSVAALKGAKDVEKAAEAELKAANSANDVAAKSKAKLESALNDAYLPMKESGDASKHATCMGQLEKVGEEFGLNSSLLTSLSSALAKAPDARGSFDGVCLQQVEDELAKLISDATDKVGAAEATKAAAADKVASASAATAAATTAKAEADEKEAACKAAVKEATNDLKAASKAVKMFGPQMKQVESDLETRKADLKGLREGALASFAELLDRSSAPPPAEEAAEAAEAAPAGEEAA